MSRKEYNYMGLWNRVAEALKDGYTTYSLEHFDMRYLCNAMDDLVAARAENLNLAMLIRRMLAHPQSLQAREQAGDYLRCNNLSGTITREDEQPTPPSENGPSSR